MTGWEPAPFGAWQCRFGNSSSLKRRRHCCRLWPRAGGTKAQPEVPHGLLPAGCWGLGICPQIILALKIILQTNLFGSRETWMKVELSCRALWMWASPNMLGITALAQLCSAKWAQVGSVMTRPIYKWLPGRALGTLFKPNPFMGILGKCGMS